MLSVICSSFRPRQLQIALQRVQYRAGQFVYPLIYFRLIPIPIEADRIVQVFRKGLPIGAFANQNVTQPAPRGSVVNTASRIAICIGETQEHFANVAVLRPVVPSLAGVDLGMRPPLGRLLRPLLDWSFLGRIEIENSLT